MFAGWVCQFNNTSTDDGGVPAQSWVWDYGDGTNETTVWSPTALYTVEDTVEGTYTVTLTVTDSHGASDSTSVDVQIGDPTATVDAHIGDLADQSVALRRNRWDAVVSILVVDPDGAPVPNATVEGLWSDGANGTDTCPTDDTGQCTITKADLKGNVSPVTFTVMGIAGTDIFYDFGSNAESTIDLFQPGSNQAPTASITTPSDSATFTSGASILFEGSANDTEDGNLTDSLSWTSSLDGAIGSGASFSAVLSDGAHSITASVTDSGGSTGSATIGIIVGTPPNQPPVASFTLENDTCGEYNDPSLGAGWLCPFTNTSMDPDSTNPPANDNDIVSFNWDYGDGTNDIETWHAGAFYNTEGFFTVTLTVTDSEGASDSTSMVVQIGNPPLPPPTIDSASGYKVKGKHTVDLTWSGAAVGVDIYRDTSLIATVSLQSGSYTDNIGAKGGASYSYVVCEASTAFDGPACSAAITVVF